jgi:hypothetical protein
MNSKIINKRTPNMRFPITNFLYINSINETILCNKCSKSIKDKEYCYLCADHNKIWHKGCFDQEHNKVHLTEESGQKLHYDYFCFIRYTPKEVFDNIEASITELAL